MAFVLPLKIPWKYHMPWIGIMNGMSHYYFSYGGGGVVQITTDYRAYLSDILWSAMRYMQRLRNISL